MPLHLTPQQYTEIVLALSWAISEQNSAAARRRLEARNAAERFVQMHLNVQPLSAMTCFFDQVSAPCDKIFELKKTGEQYWAVSENQESFSPMLHGQYVFVILESTPHRVYCAQFAAQASAKDPVYGHTSISGGDNVLFAGELYFNHARLVEWNNCSGHYFPPGDLSFMRTNLLPLVKLLLPEALYRPLML